ncbi:MAG: peptide deformylase [Bacillota bacterium]|nr:peptide deformylase [Bacillota bacterium]
MAVRRVIQSSLTGGSVSEDKFLHTMTMPVERLSDDIHDLILDLRDTLWAYPFCVGLSAPQIGDPHSVSVINFKRENRNEDLVLINPRIVELGGKKDKKRESCMSVWGKMGDVERRDKIIVEFYNQCFEIVQMEFQGFNSRVIQHEIDHLLGILYFDKINKEKSLQKADFFDKYEIIE